MIFGHRDQNSLVILFIVPGFSVDPPLGPVVLLPTTVVGRRTLPLHIREVDAMALAFDRRLAPLLQLEHQRLQVHLQVADLGFALGGNGLNRWLFVRGGYLHRRVRRLYREPLVLRSLLITSAVRFINLLPTSFLRRFAKLFVSRRRQTLHPMVQPIPTFLRLIQLQVRRYISLRMLEIGLDCQFGKSQLLLLKLALGPVILQLSVVHLESDDLPVNFLGILGRCMVFVCVILLFQARAYFCETVLFAWFGRGSCVSSILLLIFILYVLLFFLYFLG